MDFKEKEYVNVGYNNLAQDRPKGLWNTAPNFQSVKARKFLSS
jgi:hypothetical protein